MKIQLDTNKKIINIEESVNIKELIETLDKLLPNKEWEIFKLDTNKIINWNTYPIVTYPTYPMYPEPNPTYPNIPWITYCGEVQNTGDYKLNSGIFNIKTTI